MTLKHLSNKLTSASAREGSVKRVYALTKYHNRGASSRVRFSNLIPALEGRGWEVTRFPLLSDRVLARLYERGNHNYLGIALCHARRLMRILRSAPPDLWWVEKEVLYGFPLSLERMFLDIAHRAVIDYDDAVFLNYRDARYGRWGRSAKFDHYARTAAHLTVGSEYLYSEFEKRGASKIKKIPSSIPTSKYRLRDHHAGTPIIIGWIGTPVTVRFLDVLKDVLPKVTRLFPIRVHVVGARWKCPGVEVRCYAWTEESEARAIQQFDIGVMPLIDGDWEKGKCAYKLIQYMAAGVVAVGSRVGENAVIIKDGSNGFLASNSEEWIQKLALCGRDHQLRSKLGRQARITAEGTFDCDLAAAAVDGVFRKILNPSGPSGKTTD